MGIIMDAMFIFWIMGGLSLGIGLFACLPRYIKFFKCKGKTKGIYTHSKRGHGTDHTSRKVYYEYEVDGVTYKGNTGWTGSGYFKIGGECDVRYNENKPKQSYTKLSGQIITCITGTVFTIVGILTFAFGIFAQAVDLFQLK